MDPKQKKKSQAIVDLNLAYATLTPCLRSRLLNELLGPELPDKEPGLGTAVPLEAPDLEVTPAKVDLPTPPSGESENEVSSGLYLRESAVNDYRPRKVENKSMTRTMPMSLCG